MIKIDQEFKALIPALQPEEYQELKKSILSEGCRDAIVTWNGIIVDGHNRYEICTNWQVEYRTVEKEFASREDAMDWMDRNQLGRRNLTPDQRRIIIGRRYLREKKSHGGDRKSSVQFDHLNDIPTADKIATETGVSAPTVRRMAKDAELYQEIQESEPEIAQKVWNGEVRLVEAKKEARTKEIAQQRQVIASKGAEVKKSDRWNVYHGDLRTWKATKQYDWIITDPPYPKEFLPLWEVLAERAKEWLKPGGLIFAMSGQMYLDEIYESMSKHLEYYWTGSYLTPGQPTPLRQRNINTTWKPILIYSNGDYKGKIFGDVWKSEGNDKDNHKWGQSVSGMYDIISKVCLPGESILDPFCGAGTTGVAALKHGCFFDGVELEIENVNISKGRLAE